MTTAPLFDPVALDVLPSPMTTALLSVPLAMARLPEPMTVAEALSPCAMARLRVPSTTTAVVLSPMATATDEPAFTVAHVAVPRWTRTCPFAATHTLCAAAPLDRATTPSPMARPMPPMLLVALISVPLLSSDTSAFLTESVTQVVRQLKGPEWVTLPGGTTR